MVTSSRNGREVLRAADLEDLFDVRIDGLDAEAFGLEGKPHPDPFLKSAALLGVHGSLQRAETFHPGRPAGLLIGFASDEDWFEYRLEHHPEFLRRIADARAALREGRGAPLGEID